MSPERPSASPSDLRPLNVLLQTKGLPAILKVVHGEAQAGGLSTGSHPGSVRWKREAKFALPMLRFGTDLCHSGQSKSLELSLVPRFPICIWVLT